MMFGTLEALLSFIQRQVGVRTDSDDVNGSLHAKIGTLMTKNNLPKIVAVEIDSTSYSNIVNVSGKGYLIGLAASCQSLKTGAALAEIIIDSVTLATDLEIARRHYEHTVQTQGNWAYSADAIFAIGLPLFHRFNSQLRIRGKNVIEEFRTKFIVTYILD